MSGGLCIVPLALTAGEPTLASEPARFSGLDGLWILVLILIAAGLGVRAALEFASTEQPLTGRLTEGVAAAGIGALGVFLSILGLFLLVRSPGFSGAALVGGTLLALAWVLHAELKGTRAPGARWMLWVQASVLFVGTLLGGLSLLVTYAGVFPVEQASIRAAVQPALSWPFAAWFAGLFFAAALLEAFTRLLVEPPPHQAPRSLSPSGSGP